MALSPRSVWWIILTAVVWLPLAVVVNMLRGLTTGLSVLGYAVHHIPCWILRLRPDTLDEWQRKLR